MATESLTKQAGLLMAGRLLAMPLAFLVPIILARRFSIEEFGYYKQIFLIFNVLLPIIDFGITNSLFYFIPRYLDTKNSIVGQTIFLTFISCTICTGLFFLMPGKIAVVFTKDFQISSLIPLLGIFTILWHLSNILEVILIIEKKAFRAGVLTFFSEAVRSVSSILVVFFGGNIKHILIALVAVGGCRCALMAYYLLRNYDIDWRIRFGSVKQQLIYSIPFGAAVIVNGLVNNVHQYIVSVTNSSAEYAIFAIGCFQLPLIGVLIDSVAKTSLVRMAELRNYPNAFEEIAIIVSNSCRKLWLITFPIFVIFFIVAEELIEILFTDQYMASVPIFRIFIFIIPLSALLIQHVPRVFDETKFIFMNNVSVLILSVLLCSVGARYFGMAGVALGFVVAQAAWKIVFFMRCTKLLRCDLYKILPYKKMLYSCAVLIPGGGVAFFTKKIGGDNVYASIGIAILVFSVYCYYAYKCLRVLDEEDKVALTSLIVNVRLKYLRFL